MFRKTTIIILILLFAVIAQAGRQQRPRYNTNSGSSQSPVSPGTPVIPRQVAQPDYDPENSLLRVRINSSGMTDGYVFTYRNVDGAGETVYWELTDTFGPAILTNLIDDVPVNGETDVAVSSNWAYDHITGADQHPEYVQESLFDAHSVLMAISDNTPVALTVTEQTLVGRLTGGNISAVSIGIADNNILQVDQADIADNDIAKFTAAGIEGRSYSELKADLDLEIGTDVLAYQAIGIADNYLVEIDSADVADNDYAKFTSAGLEGMSYSEVKTDLSLNNVENTAISTYKLDDLASPEDNTDLNASTSAHGLLPKLSNVSTEFLNGQGSWATPAGGSSGATIQAWVCFNLNGIKDSYNVSSISRTSTGLYIVYWDTDFSNANYAVVATAGNEGDDLFVSLDQGQSQANMKQVDEVRLRVTDDAGNAEDVGDWASKGYIMVIAIGDQ